MNMHEPSALAGTQEAPAAASQNSQPVLWQPDLVGKRLVQAFVTLDRLPRVSGPRQPGCHWPRTVTEWEDELAQAELEESERQARQRASNRVIIRPSATEIAQMEAAFEWLRELRLRDSGMALVTTLWALRTARGRSIKALCAEKQWAPYTFFRKRTKALAILAEMLNARGFPVT